MTVFLSDMGWGKPSVIPITRTKLIQELRTAQLKTNITRTEKKNSLRILSVSESCQRNQYKTLFSLWQLNPSKSTQKPAPFL